MSQEKSRRPGAAMTSEVKYQLAKRTAKERIEKQLAAIDHTKAQAKVVRRQYFRGGPTDVGLQLYEHSQPRFKGHLVLVFSGTSPYNPAHAYAYRIDRKGVLHKTKVPGSKPKWEYSAARQIGGDDGYHWTVWDKAGNFRVDGLTRSEVDYYRRQVEARHTAR